MTKFASLILLALALWPGLASAASLPSPTETPILVISGQIGTSNVDGTAQFDRPMLESMMYTTIETRTPWFDGVSRFEGVLMTELMEAVGATGDTVMATALNDYVTEIPVSDFEDFGVILALKRDGEFMSVRDKGPLFIVYPYDSSPDLQSQTYFARSAWQVAELIVR
ncbi:oxidoreductase [Devosia albogilva]|uniref:Oxidoreductase n=1 Tax=Devosia albogilva TaxID=429726 RepID=A0ABW5QFG7_9HYPH